MIKYLHIDCEMGGRDLKYSLLTAFFMVTDADMNPLGELSLAVKPDDGDYIVSGQGMAVNKIDLIAHDKVALPYKAAKPLLYNFLKQACSVDTVPNGNSKYPSTVRLTPVGHGVRGDIDFVIKYLISEGSWEQFCTYHYLDTSVVLQFLRACGKLPLDTDGSVGALANYFNIPISGDLHDASVDTKTTAAVFKHFVQLGKR